MVHVADISHSVSSFGSRYLQRIYTPRELRDAGIPPDPQRLAARFAAKEAALKVLRPQRAGFNWQQIEVVRTPGGWVTLELHQAAKIQAEAEGLHQFSVSLSHEHDYAIAVVIGSA